MIWIGGNQTGLILCNERKLQRVTCKVFEFLFPHCIFLLPFCLPHPCVLQAVQLESVSSVRVRYLIIVSTLDKQESLLLGMDFPNSERCVCDLDIRWESVGDKLIIFASSLPLCSDQCTVGLVLPVWSDTQVFLDGDGWDIYSYLWS